VAASITSTQLSIVAVNLEGMSGELTGIWSIIRPGAGFRLRIML